MKSSIMLSNGTARPRLPKHPSENMKISVINKEITPRHPNLASIHPRKRIGRGHNPIVIDNNRRPSNHLAHNRDKERVTINTTIVAATAATATITTTTATISITNSCNTNFQSYSNNSYSSDGGSNNTKITENSNSNNSNDTTITTNNKSGIAAISIGNIPPGNENVIDVTCRGDTRSSVLSVPDDSDSEYEDCYENLPRDLDKCVSSDDPVGLSYILESSPNLQRCLSQEEELLGKVSQVVLKDHYVSDGGTQANLQVHRSSEKKHCNLEDTCISLVSGNMEQIIIEDDCTSLSSQNEKLSEDGVFLTSVHDVPTPPTNPISHNCNDEMNDSVIEVAVAPSQNTDEDELNDSIVEVAVTHSQDTDEEGASALGTKLELDNSTSASKNVCDAIAHMGTKCDIDNNEKGELVGNEICAEVDFIVQSETSSETSTEGKKLDKDDSPEIAINATEKKNYESESTLRSLSDPTSVERKKCHPFPNKISPQNCSSTNEIQQDGQCSLDLEQSKMIDLDEIKRELDENYVNILDETTESLDGFGFGPEDINIFDTTGEIGGVETETGLTDVTKSSKSASQVEVSMSKLDEIKLQFNICELKIAISDIYRTKSLTSSVKRKLSSMERMAIKRFLMKDKKCSINKENVESPEAQASRKSESSSEEEDDIPLQVMKDLKNQRNVKEPVQGEFAKGRKDRKGSSDDEKQQIKKNKSLKMDRDRVSKPKFVEKQRSKEMIAQGDGYSKEKNDTESVGKPSPAKVTESYEDSVAKKLAERNKRLGIPISPVKSVSGSSSTESAQKEDGVKRNLDTMTILTPSNNTAKQTLQRKPSKVIIRPTRTKITSKAAPITCTSTTTVKTVEGNKSKAQTQRPQPTFITTITLEDDDPVQVIPTATTTSSTKCIPTHPAKRLNAPAPAELLRDMMVQYDHQLQCTVGSSKNTVTTSGSKAEHLSTKSSLNVASSTPRLCSIRDDIALGSHTSSTASCGSLRNAAASYRQILPVVTCKNACLAAKPSLPVGKSTTTVSVGRGGISTILQSPVMGGRGRAPQPSGRPRHPLIRAYRPAAPSVRPPSLDFMHPSRRMSLLSQMSPRNDKLLTNSGGGTTSSNSPEKSTTRPNHPSQRMSNVLTGNSSKLRSISMSEGVPHYKPKPLSRQTHPQARILLSPQYAQQTYKPWTSANVMNAPRTGFRDEDGVIGISDSESESSGTDLECLDQTRMILHISSDDETSSDFPEHPEEVRVQRQMPLSVEIRRKSDENNLARAPVTPSSNPSDLLPSSTSRKDRYFTTNIAAAPAESISKTLIIPSDDEEVIGNISGETEIRLPCTSTKDHQNNENSVKPICAMSSHINAQTEEARELKTGAFEDKHPMRKRKIDRLTEHFNLLELQVQVINLGPGSEQRMRLACSGKDNWREKENLVRGGLPEYDIARLGVRRSQRLKSTSSRYTFRQFLKKRERYDHNSFEFQNKKLKEERRKKRQEEKRKNEISSIRRCLLRINARYLNQSRLWTQLNSHAKR